MGEFTPQEIKVVIPHVCLQSESGLLLGWKSRATTKDCYAITAVAKQEFSPTVVANKLQLSQSRDNMQVLGVILDEKDNINVDNNLLNTVSASLRSDWIVIEKIDSKEPKLTLMRHDEPQPLPCDDMIVVVYDGSEVLSSVYLMGDQQSSAKCHGSQEKTNVYVIAESLAKYQQLKQPVSDYDPVKYQINYLNDCMDYERSPISLIFELSERLLLAIFHGFISVLTVFKKG